MSSSFCNSIFSYCLALGNIPFTHSPNIYCAHSRCCHSSRLRDAGEQEGSVFSREPGFHQRNLVVGTFRGEAEDKSFANNCLSAPEGIEEGRIEEG